MTKAYSFLRRGNAFCRGSLNRSTRRSFSALTPDPPVQTTTLPNKIRVVTENTLGHFSSVGLYIDAGSRYETPETSGVCHFLDKLAFKNLTPEAQMSTALQITSYSARECMMYQTSHFLQDTPLIMSSMADNILNTNFPAEEIEPQRDAAFYESREINAKPDMILPEVLHSVAYGGKGLGNPLLCPEDRIGAINEMILRSYMKEWYKPERMVIAGSGMHHQELVELADKYFSSLKSTLPTQNTTVRPSSSQPQPQLPPHLLSPSSPPVGKSLTRAASYLFPNSLSPQTQVPLPVANSTYTGGHHFILDASQEFSHLYIAFEGVGIHDNDIYALATMQVLLGGGGSFSAGGPGKGMYSRLYTHILNHYPQIDHCASFHHIYTDSSLFGLFASFVPASSGLRGGNTPSQILPHLVHQLSLLLYTPIPQEELSRAKNQLKSSLIMALENRAVLVEDLGRQILIHNRKIPVTEMVEKVDQLQPEDIRRVASRIFGPHSTAKPTVVTMGHENTGPCEEVFSKYGVASGVGA
ncbi:hypothetical protein M378DRAFT_155132 [Amanita muscaria Koide BX008]|uniref:Mitochondrial processing peptidase alpha subunit n=1 Tax=Amanita muscaria (strain Koide BX008) TaxID=946122 RepID=A0A0C2XAX1_AMAMK|nr:hypothetical protein M378DRAFT_155132 [Amanita muscaria Koide BX008]